MTSPVHGTEPLDDARTRAERAAMVEEQLVRRGIVDQRVLAAMGRVPRHLFVPEKLRHAAYDDSPLPIGHGQTISQPLMVADTLQTLGLRGHETVLDVGAGSAYQTALLCELAARVHAIEVVPELGGAAAERLAWLGYGNVLVVVGDGWKGYRRGAPYDAIVVAAAAPRVPEALVEQLSVGGRLVIPVGDAFSQTLERITKTAPGRTQVERLTPCRFVPLVERRGN